MIFHDKHPINYPQKGSLNSLTQPIFIHTLLLSSLGMHAKFRAATFHVFGVMEETDRLTDGCTVIFIIMD